jgi:hypothetical protein
MAADGPPSMEQLQWENLQTFLQKSEKSDGATELLLGDDARGLHQLVAEPGAELGIEGHRAGSSHEEAAQWERLQVFLSSSSVQIAPRALTQFEGLHGRAVPKPEYQLYFEKRSPAASDGVHYLNAQTPEQAEACARIAEEAAAQPQPQPQPQQQHPQQQHPQQRPAPAPAPTLQQQQMVAVEAPVGTGQRKRKRRPKFVPPRTVKKPAQAPKKLAPPKKKKQPSLSLAPTLTVEKSLEELLRKLLLQSKDADEETSSAILFHTFNSNGCDQAMSFFNCVKNEPRSGGLELWSCCLSCLLISGTHDDVALQVALELRTHESLELDEIAAQLVFASLLRQMPPPPEIFPALEALVVDGLLTTTSPTDVCNAALFQIARFGAAKDFWRIFALMRTEDIEQDMNSYMCGIEMCKTDKDGHRCASLFSEMASLGLDVAPARPALLQLCATCQGADNAFVGAILY